MENDFHRPAKRSKISHSHQNHAFYPYDISSSALTRKNFSDDLAPDPGDFWIDSSLYALDPVRTEQQGPFPDSSDWTLTQETLENAFQDDPGIQNWLTDQLPFLFSVEVPLLEQRHVDLGVENPFEDGTIVRYTDRERGKKNVGKNGAVNSYIKFRIRQTDGYQSEAPKGGRRLSMSSNSSRVSTNLNLPQDLIPYLPPNFGKKWTLDETDNKLLRFYLVAFCNGRTLLPTTNAYLDIAPIAEQDEGVLHALLSLAAGYVLDYVPTPAFQQRANDHFRKAIEFLTKALRAAETHAIGKGDAAVASLVLLFTDDTVQWEYAPNPKGIDAKPRWLLGARVARTLLNNTDEGYRYWDPVNVQITDARHNNANMIAYFNIIAEFVMPLKESDNDRMYQWLLEGTPREVRRIHGSSSLSPKLLHTFGQITHLSAKMAESPDSTVIPHGAKRIEARLKVFRQWSDLSEGYATVEEMFDACVLDSEGKVDSAAMVTDLTGQTYVQTALLYLYCRFYRLPRSHPKVLQALEIGLGCLDRMPYSGPLFTAQSPFACIVLMSFIAYRPQDRNSLHKWFTAVVDEAGARSSVPPVWKTVHRMWKWFDDEMTDELYDDARPIGQRYPWWEVMVTRLMETEGVLSLA